MLLLFWLFCFFFKSCGSGIMGIFRSRTDTLSNRTDTVWVLTQGDTIYKPIPVTVTNTIYKPLYRTDTLESFEVLPADTVAILNRFYQKAFYSDTQSVSYGKIIIQDTVYQNRISSRHLMTDFRVPEVTNTVTLVKTKNVVYLGVQAVGSLTSPLYAVGGDISLKSINGKIYSVGAFTTKNGEVFYQAGYKIPIRLTKKKIV